MVNETLTYSAGSSSAGRYLPPHTSRASARDNFEQPPALPFAARPLQTCMTSAPGSPRRPDHVERIMLKPAAMRSSAALSSFGRLSLGQNRIEDAQRIVVPKRRECSLPRCVRLISRDGGDSARSRGKLLQIAPANGFIGDRIAGELHRPKRLHSDRLGAHCARSRLSRRDHQPRHRHPSLAADICLLQCL
jgi:hypothetical protein